MSAMIRRRPGGRRRAASGERRGQVGATGRRFRGQMPAGGWRRPRQCQAGAESGPGATIIVRPCCRPALFWTNSQSHAAHQRRRARTIWRPIPRRRVLAAGWNCRLTDTLKWPSIWIDFARRPAARHSACRGPAWPRLAQPGPAWPLGRPSEPIKCDNAFQLRRRRQPDSLALDKYKRLVAPERGAAGAPGVSFARALIGPLAERPAPRQARAGPARRRAGVHVCLAGPARRRLEN